MDERAVASQVEARPYRSHKLPACSACRKSKVRCNVDDPALACRYCRQRGLACDHGVSRNEQLSNGQPTAKRAIPADAATAAAIRPSGTEVASSGQQLRSSTSETEESSPIMVNPSMAEDVEVLERNMASQNALGASEKWPYVRLSAANGETIVYRTVAKRRKGLQQAATPGTAQLEIIENVLGPLTVDVIKLYFEKVHPCFPIMDESSFWNLWRKDPRRFSPTLLCDIYAVSLPYWDCSEKLRRHHRPDPQFIWNQAVLALRDDYMAPSMSTVHASLLDMLGRPVYQITGNIINAGRTVNLAHSQGLHRNPSAWRASDAEKDLRVKVWWALLIHDHWSSLSHGTPPNISSQNYDVDMPQLESHPLSISNASSAQAASSFPHLCWLTKLLGEVLPMIYSLRNNHQQSWKIIRRTECTLDDWLDSLPDCLNAAKRSAGQVSASSGASGLWFYYLSLKLVLNRLAFKVTTSSEHTAAQRELHDYRLALLNTSALSLVDYVAALQEDQFREFWLPYTSYLLVSAVTTLLRFTFESSSASNRREVSSKLSTFMKTLKVAREQFSWDLAQLCIQTCQQPIENLAALSLGRPEKAHNVVADAVPAPDCLPPEGPTTELEVAPQQLALGPHNPYDDTMFPMNLDIPWDHLWDNVVEPWRLGESQHDLV